MRYLKSLPYSILICLLPMSVGMTGILQAAGMHDGVPFQGDASASVRRSQLVSTTDRIIVKYRQPTVGTGAFMALSQRVSQATGHGLDPIGSTGMGAQIFKLWEVLPLEDVQGVIQEIEADPDVEYAEPDMRVFSHHTD